VGKAPHMRPLSGAIPVNAIPPADLDGVNQLLREGKALLQTIQQQGRAVVYVVPILDPPSQTVESGQ
jgi:hypothetical protein